MHTGPRKKPSGAKKSPGPKKKSSGAKNKSSGAQNDSPRRGRMPAAGWGQRNLSPTRVAAAEGKLSIATEPCVLLINLYFLANLCY